MLRSPFAPWLLSTLLAWSAGTAALGFGEARHLLVRTGFEATPAAIARLRPLSHERAVALLLKETRTEALTPPPDFLQFQEAGMTRRSQEDSARREPLELKGWWMRELRVTPSPLTERMTLFWHGRFPCELRVVGEPSLMYRQNV